MSERAKQRTSSGGRKVVRKTQSPVRRSRGDDATSQTFSTDLAVAAEAAAPAAAPSQASAPATFWDKWKSRTEFTFIMIGLFVALIYTGHLALVGFVFLLHVWVFVVSLTRKSLPPLRIPRS
jgi:hypothetical protein